MRRADIYGGAYNGEDELKEAEHEGDEAGNDHLGGRIKSDKLISGDAVEICVSCVML